MAVTVLMSSRQARRVTIRTIHPIIVGTLAAVPYEDTDVLVAATATVVYKTLLIFSNVST